LIFYYKTNGIISLKKHVDVDRSFITQMFEKKVNSLLRNIEEKQPLKKRANLSGGSIFKFFCVKYTFKKKDASQKDFLKDLSLSRIIYLSSLWRVCGSNV
jgi:hypothetical protein